MSAKIFICPECDEVFKTRKLANQHRREKVHKGAVIVEEVVATPKTTLKSKLPKKGNYKCPKCEKTGKTLKAIKDHMSAKNHKGEPILQVIASKIPINTNKSKPKPEPKPEPQPKKPIMAFMKLRESDAKNILKPLVEINKTLEGLNITILINPINGGYILQYYHTLLDIVDDLQFKYNFVNIEMQNTDLIFCLGLLKNISKDFRVYDTAGMKMYGTQEVVEGKIVISLDERERISWGSLIEGIDFTQPDKLACVTIVQAKVEDFEDWDVTKYASETFEAYGGRHNSMGVRYSQKPYTPPAPPTPISYPVYGITEYVIVIDRVIKYEIFE